MDRPGEISATWRVRSSAPAGLSSSLKTSSQPFLFFLSLSHQSGEIDVVNHTTGDRCHLKFAPYSYFSRDVARKVRNLLLFLL